MRGDNQYVSPLLKFYTEEMSETKRIAISHLEKKLFPVADQELLFLLLDIFFLCLWI